MTYVLRIATEEDRDLVVASLRSAADQRTRVARQAAGEVAASKRDGKDVRSPSVKVVAILAEADNLSTLADELEAAPAMAVVQVAADGRVDVDALRASLTADDADVSAAIDEQQAANPVEEDDGTSAAAQAIAAAAGLTPTIVDDGDVDTGSTDEDDPDDETVEEVLP